MKKNVKVTINQARDILSKSDVSAEEATRILNELQTASQDVEPWYVILLKVLAYLIGLLLAGMGTANAATMIIH